MSLVLPPFPEKPRKAVEAGEFVFAAVGFAHGHIYGMCEGLINAGASLKWAYDDDPARLDAFRARYPGVKAAGSLDEILEDAQVKLVACAAVPSERCGIGIKTMEAGKDFFADKAPLITSEQLFAARDAVARTGRKYAVWYSERLGSEAAVYAETLIRAGTLGRVINVIGTGPHKLANGEKRGAWFYKRATQGGILIDVGSHQIEQFLAFTGDEDAKIVSARVANFAHPEYPEFDDFGDCTLEGESGAAGYFRVDWFTPRGVPAFGDGRTFLVGTKGTLELRKFVDLSGGNARERLILATDDGTAVIDAAGKTGLPFFAALITDCLERTEKAMTQSHAFKAAELAVKAQEIALREAKKVLVCQ